MADTFHSQFKAYIFDLDDTLLDTYNCILPNALKESFAAMINAGLESDLDTCMEIYNKDISVRPRKPFYQYLVDHLGTDPEKKNQILQAGEKAFYHREVKEELKLTDGSQDILQAIQPLADLHLVTSGSAKTQYQKIDQLGIRPFFKSISIAETSEGKTKRQLFFDIVKENNYAKKEVLVIGNRRDQEINDGKSLGLRTCLVKYGEYKHLQPNCAEEVPDYEIDSLLELKPICLVP